MRILLCLLSDQHVPNLLSVHHFRPDRLVLVESEDMRRKGVADHFLNALRLGGLDYDDRQDRLPLEHEDSLPDIQRALQAAHDRHPEAEWVVNLTGGTKPMSIGAYRFFASRGATLIYVNGGRPGEYLRMDREGSEPFTYRPTIVEFLAGYGFHSKKAAEKIAEDEARARDDWELARALAAHALADDLFLFAKDDGGAERDKARRKGITLEDRHLNSKWLAIEPVRRALESAFKLGGKLDKYQVQFLTGGWLETFVWGLLDRHADSLGLWDARLGLEPARIGSPGGNDFDVSFLHNHRLVAVECKTGKQDHGTAGDILYKVEAIVRQFRALHVRTVLATTSDFLFDQQGQIKQNIQDRAGIYNCTILTRDWIRDLASSDDPAPLLKKGLKL